MSYILRKVIRGDRRVRYLITPKANPVNGYKWSLLIKDAYEFPTEHDARLAAQLHGGHVVSKEEAVGK